MARLVEGPPIVGRLGNLVFYKTILDIVVRACDGVNARKLRNHPKYEGTRKNWKEFSHTGKSAKLIRGALKAAGPVKSDPLMTSRLVAQLRKVLVADLSHPVVERELSSGNVALLTDFEFNLGAPLS